MTAPPVASTQDGEVYHQEVRRSPAFLPEPEEPARAPTRCSRWCWWAREHAARSSCSRRACDNSLERLRPTAEVEASPAGRGRRPHRPGRGARDLHRGAREDSSAATRGWARARPPAWPQDRGSRLALLRASLDVLGISSRLVAVRTFSDDPAPLPFPNEGLFPYLCLRVDRRGPPRCGWTRWCASRPSASCRSRPPADARRTCLPEPGLPLEAIRTPHGTPATGKEVTLDMCSDADGTLSGKATDVYQRLRGSAAGGGPGRALQRGPAAGAAERARPPTSAARSSPTSASTRRAAVGATVTRALQLPRGALRPGGGPAHGARAAHLPHLPRPPLRAGRPAADAALHRRHRGGPLPR